MSEQNSYEERHAERVRERSRQAGGHRLRKIKENAWIWGLALIAVLLVGFWIRNQFPKGEDRSRSFPLQEAIHIPVGSPRPEYNSDPPTSGPHYAEPARGGRFYDAPLPDEQLVHNLEHGEIWISYQPDIPQEVKDELKDFVGVFVVVTPRAENDTDIALAAWGRLDAFDLEDGKLDVQRVTDFILRYRDKGPEKVHTPGVR